MTDAVLFDMDGVLVASASPHAHSWRIVARRHGIEMSDEMFQATFGQPSRDIIRELLGADASDAQIGQLDDEKEEAYRDLIRGMVPLMIGARETLQGLKAGGLRLAIATSGPPENVELVLSETGLAAAFDAVVTGSDIRHGKPAPDCFLLAAQRCGVRTTDCVVIEDAPVGIEAARAAGMRVVGFAGTHPPARLTDAGADLVVERLADITPALVRQLLGG